MLFSRQHGHGDLGRQQASLLRPYLPRRELWQKDGIVDVPMSVIFSLPSQVDCLCLYGVLVLLHQRSKRHALVHTTYLTRSTSLIAVYIVRLHAVVNPSSIAIQHRV